jgi:hypothetical protein
MSYRARFPHVQWSCVLSDQAFRHQVINNRAHDQLRMWRDAAPQ